MGDDRATSPLRRMAIVTVVVLRVPSASRRAGGNIPTTPRYAHACLSWNAINERGRRMVGPGAHEMGCSGRFQFLHCFNIARWNHLFASCTLCSGPAARHIDASSGRTFIFACIGWDQFLLANETREKSTFIQQPIKRQ